MLLLPSIRNIYWPYGIDPYIIRSHVLHQQSFLIGCGSSPHNSVLARERLWANGSFINALRTCPETSAQSSQFGESRTNILPLQIPSAPRLMQRSSQKSIQTGMIT